MGVMGIVGIMGVMGVGWESGGLRAEGGGLMVEVVGGGIGFGCGG